MASNDDETPDMTHRGRGHITALRVIAAVLGDDPPDVTGGPADARVRRAALVIAGLVEYLEQKGLLSADELDALLAGASD